MISISNTTDRSVAFWERWGIVKIVALCVILTAILDWSRLIRTPIQFNPSLISLFIKIAAFLLIATIACTVGGQGFSRNDEWFFKVLFFPVAMADSLFILHDYSSVQNKQFIAILGVSVFALVQAGLTIRNWVYIKSPVQSVRKKPRPIICTAVIYWAVAIAVFIGIHTHTGNSVLFISLKIYSIFLWLSVTAAVLSHGNKAFPRKNTQLMMYGMISFACCDFCYMWSLSLPVESIQKVVASNLTITFYLPALLMIAMSAWKSEAPGVLTDCK